MVMTNKNFAASGTSSMPLPKRVSKAEMDTARHYGAGELTIIEVRLHRAFDRSPAGSILRMYAVDYGIFKRHGVPHMATVMGANEAARINYLMYIQGNCNQAIACYVDDLPHKVDFKPPAEEVAVTVSSDPEAFKAEPEPEPEPKAEPKPKRKYKRRKKGNH